MAKLPTRESLGGLPAVPTRPAKSLRGPDTRAIGRGVADLGRGVSKLSAALDVVATAEDREQEFETERRFQEFQWEQQQGLDTSMRDVEPGQANGFADQWAETYKASADEFARTVPDQLRGKYDLRLLGTERKFYGHAANFARGEQKRHSLAQIDDHSNAYYSRATAGEPLEDIRSDYTRIVETNPYLTPIEKDQVLRKGYGHLEETHIHGRIDRGDKLDDIIRDIRGQTSDDAEKRQSRYQQSARISARLETGVDDPLSGIANISVDAGKTKSYGNFGLNSQKGGSIFDFVKQYGEQFGLTAKPGTPAFDDQWRMAAASVPDDLHEAEMVWYGENVADGVAKKLANAGVPKKLVDDPRVQAYFADRVVQQGPGSIDGMAKHKKRIMAALSEADDDPADFLEAMTELDRKALTRDFPTALRSGVYSAKGHDTRLDGRLRLALETAADKGPGRAYSGPYQHLSLDRRNVLVGKAKLSRRATVQQDIRDGAEEIRRTGAPSVDANGETAFDRARGILTKNQFEKARLDWQEAQLEYDAFNDMDALTEDELQDRLITIEPRAGETNYEIRAKIFDRAMRRAEKIRDAREKDPADAVSDLPDVQVAEQGVRENPGDPAFKQALIQARIDAQKKIGIPEVLQSPVTKAEARVILAPTRGLKGQALIDALKDVRVKLEEEYGSYARAAASDIFEFDNRSKEMAEELTAVLDRALQDQPATAAQQRRLEVLPEIDLATRAFGGDFVGDPIRQYYGRSEGPEQGMPVQADPRNYYRKRMPPQAAIDALYMNPDLADQFDAYYGTGSSQRYLQQP